MDAQSQTMSLVEIGIELKKDIADAAVGPMRAAKKIVAMAAAPGVL